MQISYSPTDNSYLSLKHLSVIFADTVQGMSRLLGNTMSALVLVFALA